MKLLLTCLAVTAIAFTGCDKIKEKLHLGSKQPVEATTPAPTPDPSTPTPAPSPTATPKITANRSAGAIVLCYHRFEDINNAMVLKPAEFEKQMQAIRDNGFTVISMQDFLAWRRDEKQIPEKSCIITIDDGYVSGYENAWPILKKFGYPFTMFVYIDYIGLGGKSISWDQLAEMRDAGVEIGCHSYSHQDLKGRTAKGKAEIKQLTYEGWLRKEIFDSKKILEDRLGIKVSAFAYPGGVYNEEVRKVVKEAGYEVAFDTYGRRNTFSLPAYDSIGRYAIESNKPKTFEVAMAMIGGGMGPSMAYTAASPASAPASASSLETTPAQGATVAESKPLIKAVLSSLGTVEPDSVQMRISGFGAVPAKYDNATKTVSFQLMQPLRDKEYTVIVSAKVDGKKSESRWSFKYDPAAKP